MSHRLKRLTVAFTFSLYNKSAHFLSIIFPFLKHAFSKTLRFLSSSSSMEPFIFSTDYTFNDDVFILDPSPSSPIDSLPIDSLFLVSFKWWNEARVALFDSEEAEVAVDGVLYDAAKSSVMEEDLWEGKEVETEIVLELCRQGETQRSEEGVSGEAGGSGDLALISEWMFLRALKWHDDMKNEDFFLAAQDATHDLFSLQIRLSCMWRTNSLIIRISQKDNEAGSFHKSSSIFGKESDLMQVWDFSGQMNQFLMNGQNPLNNSNQADEEMLLELQVYGLYNCNVSKEKGNGEMILLGSKIEGPSCSSSLQINGNGEHNNYYSHLNQPPSTSIDFQNACSLGLTGLFNLGNTCFMNSALQCLAHTGKLVDYFLGDFRKDLNVDNPLGMNGKLAIAFGDLLRKLWFPGASPVSPKMFKSAIAGFAPQFSGYNQHDSQEFLAFLLDGLHEDLNRVKSKPYVETQDRDGCPDEEVADEHWRNHLARNSSIIVDLCQGQYRSTLVCPVCQKKSLTFDPFMYLSLPLPSTKIRTITLTVVSSTGTNLPSPVTVNVPNDGSLKNLVQALTTACALRDDETLLVAEIYNNDVLRFLDNPSDSVELIRDNDQLVAYRMPKDYDNSHLVVFSHLHEKSSFSYSFISGKKIGIPLVTRMADIPKGSEIREVFLKLLNPFLMPTEESSNDEVEDVLQNTSNENNQKNSTSNEDCEMHDVNIQGDADCEDGKKNNLSADSDFQFYVRDDKSSPIYKMEMDEPVPTPKNDEHIEVHVYWSEKMIEDYDTVILSSLPEVCKPILFSRRALESISLDKCLDAFLKEEPLGPEDMWFCPNCKTHQQASKKLDLWRLPEILVIHLKRFSYNRYFKNKLETFVDFPIEDFDLTNYINHKDNTVMHRYTLYAVSNHYGGMGGGHYTAFAQHKHHNWYEFDDSRVFSVGEDQIKTTAAYVLFYRRVSSDV